MTLEELTQEDFEHLVACGRQRAVLAAIVAGVMQLELTSKEGIAIKNTMMATVAQGLTMNAHVGDYIDKQLLTSMKEHCEEQIAMEDLFNTL